MKEAELIKFIIDDFKNCGPIAHALEIYVLPRMQISQSQLANLRWQLSQSTVPIAPDH